VVRSYAITGLREVVTEHDRLLLVLSTQLVAKRPTPIACVFEVCWSSRVTMTRQSLAPEECGLKVMRWGNRVLGHSWVMALTR
jgi:hypothetical protein